MQSKLNKHELKTTHQLLKGARNMVLRGYVLVPDEIKVRCLFDELKCRQKRNIRKRSTNHYSDWLYYVAYDGRLARVPNTNKNPTGKRLLKERTIFQDQWGLLRSKSVIGAGQFVKIRPLLEELDKRQMWSLRVREDIATYLDGGKNCTMTIDRDFFAAYQPDYHEDFCLEGDLVTGSSCMSEEGGAAEEFYGGIDGCYVVRFENEEGEQVGRCIMYKYNGIRHFIRIYAKRDYARCALRLLRAEMKEQDLFGRDEAIPNMRLSTNWDTSTRTMYLDGEYYGVNIKNMTVVNTEDSGYDVDCKTTENEEFSDYLYECDWRQCDRCGEWYNTDSCDCVSVGCCSYCCEDCAREDGCVCCEHCGEWESSSDNGYTTEDGQWFCCRDCLYAEDYVICEDCGAVKYYQDAIEVCDSWFCDKKCAESAGYKQCAGCGEWFDPCEDEDLCWRCQQKKEQEEQEQEQDETKEVK